MSSPPDEVGENQFTGRNNLSENGELRPTAKKGLLKFVAVITEEKEAK